MNNQVVILTVAYNAEKTIRRAIDSIVRQSYSKWVYYIFNNGSTDGTQKIIAEYAAADKRIIAMSIEKNDIWSFFTLYPQIISNHDKCDWFATLDADDEYASTAFIDMVSFAEANCADIIACGNDFVDAKKKKIIGVRSFSEPLLVDVRNYDRYFSVFHQFLRTIWGKLYRISVVTKVVIDMKLAHSMGYGGDTLFAFACLKESQRLVIINKSLYKYYVSPKSASYSFNSKRIESDKILFYFPYDILKDKCSRVSLHNEEFLLCVYLHALTDSLGVLMKSTLTDSQRMDALIEMFLCDLTKKLAAWEHLGLCINDEQQHMEQRSKLFSAAARWLLSRKEVADNQVEHFCKLGEFLCAACQDADGWIFIKKLFVQYLIENNRKEEAGQRIEELQEILPEEDEFLNQYNVYQKNDH